MLNNSVFGIILLKFKIASSIYMDGGKKSGDNLADQATSQVVDPVAEARRVNDAMINGEPTPPPDHKGTGKRLLAIFGLIIGLAVLSSLVYWVFFRLEPAKPAPAAAPKPTTSYVKIEGDSELARLSYGVDYSVEFSGGNYLVEVVKSPKRLIYNGTEVYRGEDIAYSSLSESGKYWALETRRQETRSKRDEATKIVQNTVVSVSSFNINGQAWGEKDNAELLEVTDNGAPVILSKSGKQTPSQYGEALNEESIYFGESEKFKTSYGVINFEMSGDGANWLVTTANPSTKEVYDFFVKNTKKDSLDARILRRLAIDSRGNYLLAFCQQPSDAPGVGILGKDCQISVNGKTRTTISGSVYLAAELGSGEVYAGVDRELKQSFLKNSRSELILEHSKDLDEEVKTALGVYLNENGNKYAITTTRVLDGKTRVNLSINSEAVSNTVIGPSLFGFGNGDDSATLFIYELPKLEE